MNRSELIRKVAERVGSEEAAARRHVDAVFEAVMESVSAGERVVVTGFGTFDRFSRPARSARNPRTGTVVDVPATEVPRFRVGQTFKSRVAQNAAPEAVTATAEEAPAVEVKAASPKKPKKDKKGSDAKADAKKTPKKAPKKAKAAKAATAPPSGKKSGKAKARAKGGKSR